MDCKKTQSELFNFIEEKDSHPNRSEIIQHLLHCSDCNQKAIQLENYLLLIDKMKIKENNDDFFSKLMEKKNSIQTKKLTSKFKFTRIAAAAAIFIITSSVGIFAGYFTSNQLIATENIRTQATQYQNNELATYTDNSFSLLDENSTNE